MVEGSLEVKRAILWTDGKRWEEPEKRRQEK